MKSKMLVIFCVFESRTTVIIKIRDKVKLTE